MVSNCIDIRPSEKIQISCIIFNKLWSNLIVKGLIFTAEQEIASGVEEFVPSIQKTLVMIMPNNIRHDEYFLRVEGKLPSGELVFSNQSLLIFEQKAVSIIIQLNKVDFKHADPVSTLKFRCVAIYQDLSPYFGTMDVVSSTLF
jgi:hypothetical protein